MESGGDQKRGHTAAGDGSDEASISLTRQRHPHTPSLIFILMRPFSATRGRTGLPRRGETFLLTLVNNYPGIFLSDLI
ncbi:hypothetical protein E2C01_062161 [Portunus trituberculatus]|uniref:Uncharacterized protein n=1 Tax=Portunus trituberculatus TaxID=210409 RepID=A0A5B7HA81_PORTR|nr:hypothetical protein [Portunus trituberculatus]